MERIYELNFGEIDKNSGKPIVYEIHIDSDSFVHPVSLLSLIHPSIFEHEEWHDNSSKTLK